MILSVAAAAPPFNGCAVDCFGNTVNFEERCTPFNAKVFRFPCASGDGAELLYRPVDGHAETLLIELIEFVWRIVFLGEAGEPFSGQGDMLGYHGPAT